MDAMILIFFHIHDNDIESCHSTRSRQNNHVQAIDLWYYQEVVGSFTTSHTKCFEKKMEALQVAFCHCHNLSINNPDTL